MFAVEKSNPQSITALAQLKPGAIEVKIGMPIDVMRVRPTRSQKAFIVAFRESVLELSLDATRFRFDRQ